MTDADSLDDLGHYLEMLHQATTETGFRILNTLSDEGEVSPTSLAETLEMEKNSLHYHIDKLTDAGLVKNRKRSHKGSDGYYSYYIATPLGERAVESIRDFVEAENDFLDQHPTAADPDDRELESSDDVTASRPPINNSVAAGQVEQSTSYALKRQSGTEGSSGALPDA
jgi:DNA-binding MarR family transcriptional regulator